MSVWKCFPCMRLQTDEIVSVLDYSSCALTDVPPDVFQHERTLEELYLSSNRIKALSPQLFYCQSMRILFVNDNELESLPNAIGSFRQLQTLNLTRNGLSTVPDNIRSCKNLTRLELSLNNLEKLPDAITNLISLQELLLNETNLQFLPGNFGRLVYLRILELRSNNLITLPKSMSRLVNLTRIDIGANEFTELPEVICQLVQLRELWIDVNRIRRISPNVSNLKELKHFEANNNLLLSLPNEITNWQNLEVLSISKNDMESLPPNIGLLKNLVTLQCDDNQLGELPDSVCNLENLEEMVISHNYILRLPNTIGMLRKLRFLCADENVLRSLPAEICSCINLTVLSVRCNKITELPQNIGHLVNLNVLNLVDNCMTFLPVSILNLTKLTALWISNNQSQPLVPLQYLNTSNKTHLTCFMLPQQTSFHEQVTQTEDPNSDSYSTNSWLQQNERGKEVDHVLKVENFEAPLTANENFSEPHRTRLAYAYNERALNTIAAQNDAVVNPSRKICFADEVKGVEMMGTRLMRSPTPYPKELLLMAKYVRNHTPTEQFSTYSRKIDKVQSTILAESTSNLLNKLDDDKCLSLSVSQNATPMSSAEAEARVSLNPNSNFALLKRNTMNEPFFNSETSLDLNVEEAEKDLSNKQMHQHLYGCRKDSISEITSNQEQENMQLVGLREVKTLQSAQHHQYYQCQDQNGLQLPQCYPRPHDPLLDHSNSLNPISNMQNNIQVGCQAIHSVHQCKPPPYHIARAFTKKSREDLLNYDSFRNQIHNGNLPKEICNNNYEQAPTNCTQKNIHNQMECYERNGYEAQSHVRNQFSIHSLNEDETIEIENSKTVNSTESVRGLTNDQSIYVLSTRKERQQHTSEIQRPFFKCVSNSCQNPAYDESVDCEVTDKTPQGPAVGNKKIKMLLHCGSPGTWLFGTHKNPTVKQISIKREPDIGFDIQEKPNQGIFVRETHPNTSAASLLYPDDKLLEVDGYDFTKMNLKCAKQILNNSGPVINVMISRS